MRNLSVLIQGLLSLIFVGMFPLLADEELLDAERMRSLGVGDASLKVDQLKIMLNPMTKDELNELSHAWRNSLKKTVQNISDINLKEKLSLADEARKSAFIENKLKQLILFRTVLAESKKKGGDLSDLEMYANAVSGAQIAVNDDAGFWSKYSSWIYSKEGGVKLGIQILKFLAVILLFWFVAGFVRSVVRKAAEKSDRFSELLEQFMIKISFRAVMILGLIVALGTVGINVAALLTIIGGASFIIAFALQDTLSNFAAGVMLLIYRPFDVGDMVEVGGVSGKIGQVSLVSTTINTFDNKVVLVPNKNVWGQIITNSSASKERRIDMIFGIGYDDDSEKAKQILEQIVIDHELVLDEPEPVIQLHELADSSVNFICRPWVKTENYSQVQWDILKKAKSEFDQAGISFPYPQQDVHIHQVN